MPRSCLRLPLRSLGLFLAAGAFASPASAANPVLRHQEDLHGDVVVFGSTLGFDCGAGLPAPSGAIASCTGQLNVSDTAPDLYWRDGTANASITPTAARTSATLVVPPGATITYARLYWAALKDGAAPDTSATLDWLGGPQQTITADTTWVVPYGFATHPTWNYYQSSGDATDFVAAWGAGDFRVSDVEALPLANQDVDRAFSAWTLVVFYENPGDELRNLALFDSFTPIDPGMPGEGSAQVTLNGFLVPQGFSARMSAFTYEGDAPYTGDHFTLNGKQLADAQNPADNFFNSSRTYEGTPVSGVSDVPQLSGAPGSMAGYDLDTVDVTGLLNPGDTSAVVGADSTYDIFFLGGFVTSVISLSPDFHGMTKTVVDLDGGAVLPGDVLEYTIAGINSGNDTAVSTVITDVLPAGLGFVPGSIKIAQGGNAGTKTDAPGDDEGEYDAATRTITWRVGAGTTGTVQVSGGVTVSFRAKVTVNSGTVDNQALLTASGLAGALPKTWYSDGDPLTIGDQPTTVVVDQCDADAQCSGTKPHCDPTTHVCVGCASDADCKDPAHPACEPTGACGQCSATNSAQCSGATPVCDVTSGDCVLCTLGSSGSASLCQKNPSGPVCVAGAGGTVHCGCLMDSDCGGPMSGKVCDSVPSVCIDGCRGMGGNGCPTGDMCTSMDSTIGECEPDTPDGGSGAGGNGGEGGRGENGSTGSGAASPGDKGNCACEAPGVGGGEAGGAGLAAAMLGLAAMMRRRRSIRQARR
jgi:uncharacterized repeat protein (TIGR01451 family)/MYXO-CTERM domain-containing protein